MTEQLRSQGQAASAPAPARRTVRADLPVAGTTAAAAAAAWAVWTQVADVTLEVDGFGGAAQEVGVASVVVSTIVVVLAGGALLRWMQRRSESGRRRWTWVAIGFAVLSLVSTTSALTASAGIALASLHLLVAAVAIPWLRRAHRPLEGRA
ncbi:DUF6069 family protein [Mumia sp. DW29H23]|uniref:DUF6069 family protein n=1 Tax=Mumia sp. DW29H23 TaxID=3421241 RepID=UPI003D693EA4